jgi:aspartyl protease family protein
MQRYLIWIIVALGGLLIFKAMSWGTSGLDGDDSMRIVYYSALVLLVGSGIFAAQRNMGEAFRNLAIWTLIILGLVTAYLYRNDVQDVASRVTAGLVPGRAATVVDENGFSTVVLYKAQNGHYQADATINGSPISMMVDTGASTIALSYEDAERVGLNPQNLDFNQMVMTANGPARTAYVTLADISIGGIQRTNVRAGVAERGKLAQSLLGMNFMETLSSVSFSGDELKLRD